MAPKRAAKSSAPPPPPPPAASSNETTDSRSRSEESEDEETTAVSLSPASKKNPPATPQKGEESESETSDEEEEDEEPANAAPPFAPKNPPPPEGDESDTSDEEEEDGESESASDEEAPPTKPAPEQKAEDLKPAAPFQRVWSTDDDIRILEALADHRREHGELLQPDALVAAVAGSLDNRAYGSKELWERVRKLKRQYINLSAKKNETPSKEHDRRLLDLSKIVWAPTTTVDGEPREFGEMCEMYPYLAEDVKELDAAHPGIFKTPFGRIDDDKARALDKKIKKQRMVQMKVELRRGDLVKEVTKTLMELLR